MKLRVHHPLAGLHPRHALRRWLDELVHRAGQLPHVHQLRERERTPHDEGVRRLLEWALDVEVPLVARSFVPADALQLQLAEVWDEAGLGCDWCLRSRGLPTGAATARGVMHFAEDGLHVTGEVQVDLRALPQLPAALARSAGPVLEQAIARNIERGYRQLAEALL